VKVSQPTDFALYKSFTYLLTYLLTVWNSTVMVWNLLRH